MNYIETYSNFLKKRLNLKKPLTIVCDGSNGTTGIVLEKLKDVQNLTLHLINTEPHGDFPAHGPNPLEPHATDALSKKVIELKADFGVIFDADGDRAFIIDEQGKMLPSFMTAILLFKNNKPPFVSDELVYQALKHLKLYSDKELKPSKVGSFFVKEELKKFDASVAPEFSGHYYYKAFFGVDSGIFTMIEVANAVSAMNTSLSSFFTSIPTHELVSENINTEGKSVSEILKKIGDVYAGEADIGHRDGITLDLGESWISIRSSNTEPILRLIAGAPTQAQAQKLVDDIKALV